MKTFLNILWIIFGGLVLSLAWVLIGLLMYIFIITIPWAQACFRIAGLCLTPFGKKIVSEKSTASMGALRIIGNILWFIFGGLWLGLGHIATAVLMFVSLIGIPFGLQHIKIAKICFFPLGKKIVDA